MLQNEIFLSLYQLKLLKYIKRFYFYFLLVLIECLNEAYMQSQFQYYNLIMK
jgi:hypothetical protein